MLGTTKHTVKLLTYAEVAELLRVGRRTITAWVSAGRLPVIWVGPRSPRILEADLRAFLAKKRVTH